MKGSGLRVGVDGAHGLGIGKEKAEDKLSRYYWAFPTIFLLSIF